MRRIVSAILFFSLILSLFSVFGYAAPLDTYEDAKRIIEAAYEDQGLAMKDTDEKAIMSKYFPEIEYVENKYNVKISEINEDTMTYLKQEAAYSSDNGRNRFSELMSEISVACAEYKVEQVLRTRGGMRSDPVVEITVVRPYGVLQGEFWRYVPTGTSVSTTRTGTVTVSANSELYGFTIEGSVSESTTYTCNGPDDGATLYNGTLATHRAAFGVLKGSIIKHVVTYSSGGKYTFYYISANDRCVIPYTTLVALGSQVTYVNRLRGTTAAFANELLFHEKVKEDPAYFLP